MINEHEYKLLADWSPKEGERFIDEDGETIEIHGGLARFSYWEKEFLSEVFGWFDAMSPCRPLNRTPSDPEASMYENERAFKFLSEEEKGAATLASSEGRIEVMSMICGTFRPRDSAAELYAGRVYRIIPKPKTRKLTISEAQELLCEKLGEDVVIEGVE